MYTPAENGAPTDQMENTVSDTLDDLMPSFRSEYDEKSLGMLSDILSTLYANPERSVMREYIANAIDSHKLAGTTAPVKVTLPTPLSPTLVVQDFGDGLDMDGLRNTFFKYVASTKTDDDNQIGALGIGAKSAFALTKSWTVTNVHQGVKFVIASVNDPYGPPKQSVIVNGEPTDEPSGITVSIPISDRYMRHEWAISAARLSRWFPNGSVEFHGRNVDDLHWTEKYASYGNSAWDHRADTWRNSYGSDEMYVVMCGIAYSVDSTTRQSIHDQVRQSMTDILTATEGRSRWEKRASFNHTRSAQSAFTNGDSDDDRISRQVQAHAKLVELFVTRIFMNTVMVDAGDIDFMPSRESVKGTPRTVDTIAAAVTDTIDKFSTELVAIRKLPAHERAAKVRDFMAVTVPDANDTTAFDAVGVHNLRTNIFRKNEVMGLHGLLGRTKGNAKVTLVTGVEPSAPLYKINVVERQLGGHGGQFFTTHRSDAHVDEFGSVAAFFNGVDDPFSSVMTLDEYKKAAKEVAPASRAGGTVSHRWWKMTPDAHESVEYGVDTFDDLMDAYADQDDVTVYLTDHMGTGTFKRAADKGVSGIVIFRGRRHVETFDRELGRETRTTDQLTRDADRAWMSRCVERLSSMDATALYRAALYRETTDNYVNSVDAVLRSPSGEALVSEDHRARRFVIDYAKGEELMADKTLDHMVRTVMESAGNGLRTSELITDELRVILDSVDPHPWPLIGASMAAYSDSTAFKHAAVYLAAVG